MISAMQVLSDLHLEFHADGGAEFVRTLIPTSDILVVAGDLSVDVAVLPVLTGLCRKFKTVVYVFGNHELYGNSFLAFRRVLAHARVKMSNLIVLDNEVATIEGQRVLGTTMWFPDGPFNAASAHRLSDFDLIEDFASTVYNENAAAVSFLRRELRFGDIVVTHHLPAAKSVHPLFAKSPLTPFFLCDLTDLILDRKPAIWVHGHTHASLDYLLGATRIVCNPMGYLHDPNSGFVPGLLLTSSTAKCSDNRNLPMSPGNGISGSR